jgi:hypothetical protein
MDMGVGDGRSDNPIEERILYIDGIPRPDRLWYEVVRLIAPHLLVEHYRTAEVHSAVTTEGWKELVAALEQHGEGLSLPGGLEHPIEVVPAEVRHKLWLQTCLGHLGGLGQDEDLTLGDPEEHYRIEEFIACLREHKESVKFLDLTVAAADPGDVCGPDGPRLVLARVAEFPGRSILVGHHQGEGFSPPSK